MLYKIRNRFYLISLCLVFFSTLMNQRLFSQEKSFTKPAVTGKTEEYKKQVRKDSTKLMVELKSMIPGLVYDLRYATLNNFMHRLMYPAGTSVTFLRLNAAKNLQKVQQELNSKGLGLKIFDAYRPYSVTVKFWELVHDERFVANPSKGSGHNRGVAVDLTLIQLENKSELPMGTGFDNFSDTAHHQFSELTEDILQNRMLLKSTMEKYGFRAYADEWWHYSIPDGNRYEILDIPFRKLNKSL